MTAVCTRETHAAIKRDPNKWASLRYLGLQADGPGHVLEMRNCRACGSTLAKRRRSVGEGGATIDLTAILGEIHTELDALLAVETVARRCVREHPSGGFALVLTDAWADDLPALETALARLDDQRRLNSRLTALAEAERVVAS